MLRLMRYFGFACLIVQSCLANTNIIGIAEGGVSLTYKKSVLAAMLAEANVYAERLGLNEKLPITEADLQESFVATPRLAGRFGALGSFRTTNYSYGFGNGKHLSYITRLPKDKSQRPLYERFKPWLIDKDKVNTNAAYTLAHELLEKAFIDEKKLASAKLTIEPLKIRDMMTSIYTVEWDKDDAPLVTIGIDERKPELWTLRVEGPDLIFRKPLEAVS